MYEDYFSLSGPAFGVSPDPTFFFGSRTHNKAMSYLYYGLKQGDGFIVVTGAAGAGKTILVNRLIEQEKRSGVTAAALPAPMDAGDELLARILAVFGVDGAGARSQRLEIFERFLFEELARGRRVALIVDEAQNLSSEAFEELRMLTTIDYDGTPLFQAFLIGAPALEDRLRAPELTALKRRVIASCRLDPLTQEETREYILHRLSAAGWREDPVFTDGAFARIYEETSGAPIRINLLCNRIMLYCAVEKRHEATAEIVEAVLREMRLESPDMVADAPMEDNMAGADAGGDAPAADRPAPPEGEARPSISEFDRLIGPRRVDAPNEDRQEATLSDVASAIAAAANGGIGDAPAYGDAAEPVSSSENSAIGDVTAALRDAEAMVAALRGAADTRRRAWREREAAIASGLARAEDLIAALRRINGRAVS